MFHNTENYNLINKRQEMIIIINNAKFRITNCFVSVPSQNTKQNSNFVWVVPLI